MARRTWSVPPGLDVEPEVIDLTVSTTQATMCPRSSRAGFPAVASLPVDLSANVDSPSDVAAVARLPRQTVVCLTSDSEEDDPFDGKNAGRAYKSDPNERNTSASKEIHSMPRKRQRTSCNQGTTAEPSPGVQVFSVQLPEHSVLEVFPDAELSHVKRLLCRHNNKADVVIAILAENSYPKVDLKPVARGPEVTVEMIKNNSKEWQYDFMSTESFQPECAYVIDAELQLLFDCKWGCVIAFYTSPSHLSSFTRQSPFSARRG